MNKIFFLSLITLLFLQSDAFAAKRYWVASDPRQWNATSRWATTSGGMSGFSVPGASDTAYFDGNGVGVCTLNVAVDVKRIEILSGYTGTIVHQGNTMTVGSGNAVMGGGTFSGGTVAITINGSLTISGTAFTSTTNTLTVTGNFTKTSGSFSDNSGTVLFTTSNTIDGTFTFTNLTFTPAAAATHDILNTLTVNGTLTMSGSNRLRLTTGTIDTKSTVTVSNSGTDGGGNATVKFSGSNSLTFTGNSTIGAGALPKVLIDKSGGTLSLSSTISVQNDWTWNAGTISAGGTTKVAYIDTLTISGSHTLNHVTFESNADAIFTIGSSTTLTVNGTLATGGSGKLTFNTSGSGAIDATSHVTLSNTGQGGGGSALVKMTGSGSVNLTGNGAVGRSVLPKFQINRAGAGGTVVIIDTVSAGNNWTWTAGSLTTTNSHVAFLNSCTIAGTHTLNIVTFRSSTSATYVIANTLTVNGVLSTRGAGALTFNTGTIDAKSTIKLHNTGSGGGGDATITITGSANVTMYGNNTVGQSALPKLTINKSGGTLTLSDTITAANNWTRTAGDATPGSSTVAFVNALTIAGTDTLNTVVFTNASSATFVVSNTIVVNGILYMRGSGALTLNTGTINVKGDIVITNTGTGGGGSATITLTGSGAVKFDSNVSSNRGRMPHVTINKSGGSVTLMDTISVAGNWVCSTDAYVTEGSSTVFLTGTKTITGIHTLNNVYFDGGTHTVTSGDTMKVAGILRYTGTTAITINTGVIAARGDVRLMNTSTGGGGTGLLLIDGTAVQEVLGNSVVINNNSRLPNVRIKKTGGSVTLKNCIIVTGDWTYTSGTVVAHSSSTVGFGLTKTISGTLTLNKVAFSGSTATFTIASGTVLTVADTLLLSGANSLTFNGDTIIAQKHVIVANTGTGTGGDAKLKFGGSNNQDLVGSGVAGSGGLPSVVINKSGGTLTLKNTITAAHNWLYIAGTVDASTNTSTVTFKGTFNLDAQGTSSTMSFWNLSVHDNTRTLTGNLDVDNNVSIGASSTLAASSYTCYVGGNWSNAGTFSSGTSTVIFNGVKHNTISRPSAVESFYNLTFNRAYDAGVKKSVTLGSRVDVTNNLTLTRGRIKTTSSFYLRLINNVTCTGGSDTAYVDGPMRKLGDDAFTFPLGDTVFADTASYHPLTITAPASTSDEFEGEYYGVNQTAGDSLVDSLATISNQEYWRLDRKVGSSTVYTTLGWNKNSSYVQNYNTLRVANWNNVKWLDLGGTGVAISGGTGTVTAVVAPSYVSGSALLTLSSQVNPETYAVLHRKLDGGYYVVKNGALYFMYDEEYNDTDDQLTFTIYDQQRRVVASSTGTYAIGLQSDYGDNRFYINLFDCSLNANGSLGSGVFILEVTNEKNEKWLLRFKHVTTITPNCPGSGGGPE